MHFTNIKNKSFNTVTAHSRCSDQVITYTVKYVIKHHILPTETQYQSYVQIINQKSDTIMQKWRMKKNDQKTET